MAKETTDEARDNGEEIAGEVATVNPGDVATVDAGTMVVRSNAAAERFTAYIRDRAAIEAPLVAKELTISQLSAIMEATTPQALDEAMKILGVVGLRDFEAGTEMRIHAFHVAPGTREDYKNSLEVFAVIEATLLATGQLAYIDTGVERVIAYLRACEVMERFPLDVRVVKQQTGRGNDMITLQPVPARVVTT